MLSKIIRLSLFGTASGVGANYVLDNYFQKEANSLGIIRFGRATMTVSL